LTFEQLIRLGSNFTIQQFLSREKFKVRWDKGEAVYVHEMFYALMQGYDAFMLKADIQVGGTDQLFNIVTAGRKIMTFMGAKPNIGIIVAILPGTDGVVKMSKSLGNHIPINTNAEDMYGKVMSIPDFAMGSFARLVTRWTPDIIEAFDNGVKDGSLHPRDAKMKLAKEIAASFYSDADAEQAELAFVRLFQQRDLPVDMQDYILQAGQTILDVLTGSGLVKSNGEGRRLVEQRGVRLDDQVISDARGAASAGVLQVGKRNFLRLVKP
jgi:tyrosyl-tRNA synthetase